MTPRPWNNPYAPAPVPTVICPHCRREAAPGPVCPCDGAQQMVRNREADHQQRVAQSRVGMAFGSMKIRGKRK